MKKALVLLIVLAALLMPAFAPSARAAPATVTFATTSAFDAGTKASVSTISDTCENVTANRFGLNNTGNYQGIGLTTGTSTCATGAWGVSTNGLVLAYDMQTLRSGKMKDFSGNGLDGTIVGSPTSELGKFGRTLNFTGIQYIAVPFSPLLQFGTGPFSISVWIRTGNGTLYTPYMGEYPANATNGRLDLAVHGGFVRDHVADQGSVHNIDISNAGPNVTGWRWHNIISLWNPGTLSAYVDGSLADTLTVTGFGSISSVVPLTIGNRVAFTGSGWSGDLDKITVYRGLLSPPEIASLSTDGRSSFFSSGSWRSPNQALTSAPILAQITFSGGTASNHPSRLRIFSAQAGAVVFDALIPSSLASPVQIPVNLTFLPTTWSVKIDMIGNGSATAFVSSVVFSLANQPLLQTSDLIFITFLILIFGMVILSLVADFPPFMIIAGISGLLFAFWLFTQTNEVQSFTLLLGVSSVFFLLGCIWAVQYESSG